METCLVPEEKRLVDNKWIFKKIEGSSKAEGVRYNARLVAKPFSYV